MLVTGSAGRLGQAAVRGLLAAGLPVRGFDRVPTPGLKDFSVGTLQDPAAVAAAMDGVVSLIHLAATPDDGQAPGFFVDELVPNNVVGLYHVMEAAREAGVRRVVLASSGQVNWYQQYEGPLPVRAQDPITPRHWYAATKVFMESIGFGFTRSAGMTVIAVRLGWCPRRGQAPEIARSATAQDVYLSPGDAGRFFARCVLADIPQAFHVLYAGSLACQTTIFDLEPARRLLGWVPQERWPQGAEEF